MADHRYRDLGAITAMTTRLRVRLIHETAGVALVATEWRRGEHPERSEGSTPYFALEVMRRGAFEKRGRRRSFHDAGVAAWFEPGERFEVRHPVGDANAGFTLRFATDVGARSPSVRSTAVPSDFLLQLTRIAANAVDALECDERLLRVAAVALAIEPREPETATRADHDLAAAARGLLVARFAEPLRLDAIAAPLARSPWHVAKVFRKVTGSSLHAWLTRLRLRHALARIADCDDLTALALECGFSTHSHFGAAFRREFGLTPSTARVALRARGCATLARFRPPGEQP
jgi:AraC family transcriptional regulator